MRVTDTESFIKKSRLMHGNKYSYDKTVYVHSQTPIIVGCPEHGEFKQRPSAHYNLGCVKCLEEGLPTVGLTPLEYWKDGDNVLKSVREKYLNNIPTHLLGQSSIEWFKDGIVRLTIRPKKVREYYYMFVPSEIDEVIKMVKTGIQPDGFRWTPFTHSQWSKWAWDILEEIVRKKIKELNVADD
jgi:hypothetical protein